MRSILALFICVLFGSCVTQSKCDRKFPSKESDSTYTVVTYDTYWDTISIPREELSFDTSGIVPPDITFHHIEEKGHLKATLDIRNGKITQTCVSDSLARYIEKLRATKGVYQAKHVTKIKDCEREHPTKWNIYFRYSGYVLHILILIYFIAWLVKKYFKKG